MDGLKSSVFCLVILTLFAYGSNQRVGNVCSRNQIPCDDSQCILRHQWCDGRKQCYDGSDEKYCKLGGWFSLDPNSCKEKHFRCDDKRCYPASVKCDGFNDCSDFSDEEYCGVTTPAVTPWPLREESTTVEQVTEDNFQKAVESSSLTENYGRHDVPFARNSWPDVDTTSQPTSTDHYHIRRMESANQNSGRTNRNGRNSDGHDYSSNLDPEHRTYAQNINRRHPQNFNHNGRFEHGNYDYNGYYQRNHSQTYGQNRNINSGGQYGPTESLDYRPNQPSTPAPYHSPATYPRLPDYQTTPRYDLFPQSRHFNVQGRGLTLIPPRSVLYPPELRTSQSSSRRQNQRPAFRPFYFQRNFTLETKYEHRSAISRAKEWILAKRNQQYSWGRDTPRALTALSLISNSFSGNITENDLMRKSLKTHLGLKLLRNNTGIEKMSTTRLAMYIHALLATCQDPRDFWGMDLTEILHSRKNHLEPYQKFVNPLVYLSLCLTDQPISHRDMQELTRMVESGFPDEASKVQLLKMQHSLRGTCFMVGLAACSTALAIQAFMSSNLTSDIDLSDTLETLARSQADDGSFGDMQATYYIVLALSGRSLLHLRNTQCDPVEADKTPTPPPDCRKIKVFLSLRVGHPEIFSTSIQLTMCDGASAYDAMRIAADLDPRFKFHYKITDGQLGVHTIANVPSDAERGLYWNLYVLSTPSDPVDTRLRYRGDIRELRPRDGTELLYWYMPIQLN